jgi:hypothetical protein
MMMGAWQGCVYGGSGPFEHYVKAGKAEGAVTTELQTA